MTIEEKAEAYDQALKVLHKYDGANIMFSQSLKEEMFPELAESKDEKVKKSLIRLVKAFYDVNFPTPEGFTKEQLLSWIEEQGEQSSKNTNKECLKGIKRVQEYQDLSDWEKKFDDIASMYAHNKNQEGYNESWYVKERAAAMLYHAKKELDKQGEQKPVDKIEPKFKVGDIIRHKEQRCTCKITAVDTTTAEYGVSECSGTHLPFDFQDAWELVEQKLAEWSEDTQQWIDAIIKDYEGWYDADKDHRATIQVKINILKSLRPQNWTKEDKERYISCLQRLGTGNPEQPETINSKWFKEHVYPQPTWKPSEEQLGALEAAVNGMCIQETLYSLYQDLNKLTE